MKTPTNYIISDEMALGFFDADGGILLSVEKNKNKVNNSIGFKVNYFAGQSLSKKDMVEKFAEKFGGKTLVDKKDAEFRVNQFSPEGQRVRAFLQKNQPKNPYRLRDFYISEQAIPLLQKRPKSRVELLTLARLFANKSRLLDRGESNAYFQDLCAHINATAEEIKQGSQVADQIISKIEENLQNKQKELATTSLSDDYVLGAHFGDGSLYIALSWKPTLKKKRLSACAVNLSGLFQVTTNLIAKCL